MRIVLSLLFTLGLSCEASLVVNGAFSDKFQTSTLATGLNYPVGLTRLADGSFLAGTTVPQTGSGGTGQFAYYLGAGEIVRLASGTTSVVASNLPGAVTGVQALDHNLIVVSTVGNQTDTGFKMADLTFLRVSANGTDAYANVGAVHFEYQKGGDAASLEPGVMQKGPGSFKIIFGLEALGNDGTPGGPVTLSGLISAELPAGSVDSLSVDTSSAVPVVTDAAQLASGIRNTTNPVIDANGNIYFGDNNYDTGGSPVNTDELNKIESGTTGIPFYGYPGNYTEYGSGTFVGVQGIRPLTAFQPSGGRAVAGIASLAIAPELFPAGWNNGVFAGFHGGYYSGGVQNTSDPVVFIDPAGSYVDFLPAGQTGLSHPDSLFSTPDSLYVVNMFTGRFDAGTGEIDVITAASEPGTVLLCFGALAAVAVRGRKK